MRRQPLMARCIEARSVRSPCTTSAPSRRRASARWSSRRTIARTLCPLASRNSVRLRPMPPTAPAAPVTRIGLSCLWFAVMSLTLGYQCRAEVRTGLAGLLTEYHLCVTHADAVRRMRLEDLHAAFVGLRARPVALPLEHDLQGGHRYHASLDGSLDRALMRLDGDVAASVGGDMNVVPFRNRLEGRKADAHLRPQPCDDDFLSTISRHGNVESL